MANQPKRFKAMLERGTEGLGWTIARLPFDPHKAWTKMPLHESEPDLKLSVVLFFQSAGSVCPYRLGGDG
jgi:hypothetical protein